MDKGIMLKVQESEFLTLLGGLGTGKTPSFSDHSRQRKTTRRYIVTLT